jgi:hypothetical protein
MCLWYKHTRMSVKGQGLNWRNKKKKDHGKSKSMIVVICRCSREERRIMMNDHMPTGRLGNLICKKEWTTLSLSIFNWFWGNMLYGQSSSKAYKRTLCLQPFSFSQWDHHPLTPLSFLCFPRINSMILGF